MRDKWYLGIALLFIGIVYQPIIGSAETGLNANEREIIAYMEAGIEYEGKIYHIPSNYMNQGINYLKQEGVDITEEQKAKVYQKIEEMALDGIKQGYLVQKSKENKKSDDTKATKAEELTVHPEDRNDTTVIEQQGENSTFTQPIQPKLKVTEPVVRQKELSLSKLIDSAKELANDFRIGVSFDAEKKHVKVVNEGGRPIMLADKTIKNTGFRLNQTFGISLGLLTLIGVCIYVSYHYQLFAHEDET